MDVDDDSPIAVLVAVTGFPPKQCSDALTAAGGNVDFAAELLLTGAVPSEPTAAAASSSSSSSSAAAAIGPPPGIFLQSPAALACVECGARDEFGHFGTEDHEDLFYCNRCWRTWEGDDQPLAPQVVLPPEDLPGRSLGGIEETTWEAVGRRWAIATCRQRPVPLQRACVDKACRERWGAIAGAAKESLERREADVPHAMAFLRGAASAAPELWELLTIYELQTADLLPRRWNPPVPPPTEEPPQAAPATVASGCTGMACASSGLAGQTEEVDVYVYDYGRLDRIARLNRVEEGAAPAPDATPRGAIIYDPACTCCPIGLSVGNLAICRFTLYPVSSAVAENVVGGLPLAAVLWELLLSERSLDEACRWLQSLFGSPETIVMASGAALLLSEPGGAVIVEWSRSQLWLSPMMREGILLHANHCVVGSLLTDVDRGAVARLNDESKLRQSALEAFYEQELLAGRAPPLLEERLRAGLSTPGVVNDSVLATVVLAPCDGALTVRFRTSFVNGNLPTAVWQRFKRGDLQPTDYGQDLRQRRWGQAMERQGNHMDAATVAALSFDEPILISDDVYHL